MYNGILLDIDNTLYSYDPCHEEGMRGLSKYAKEDVGIDVKEFLDAFSVAKTWVKYNLAETASSHNRLLYLQKTCELLGLSSLKHSLSMYNIYWDSFFNKMTLSEDADYFLNKYKEIPICLVTDLTSHIQYKKIDRLGLVDRVKYMVTSEECGHEKPHPYIYQLALMKMNLTVSQVCMVGDSLVKDALGPANIGIKGYWYCKYIHNSQDRVNNQLVEKVDNLSDI